MRHIAAGTYQDEMYWVLTAVALLIPAPVRRLIRTARERIGQRLNRAGTARRHAKLYAYKFILRQVQRVRLAVRRILIRAVLCDFMPCLRIVQALWQLWVGGNTKQRLQQVWVHTTGILVARFRKLTYYRRIVGNTTTLTLIWGPLNALRWIAGLPSYPAARPLIKTVACQYYSENTASLMRPRESRRIKKLR